MAVLGDGLRMVKDGVDSVERGLPDEVQGWSLMPPSVIAAGFRVLLPGADDIRCRGVVEDGRCRQAAVFDEEVTTSTSKHDGRQFLNICLYC